MQKKTEQITENKDRPLPPPAPVLSRELDIREIFRVLFRRRLIIISALVPCLTAAAVYIFTATPLYTARALLTLSFKTYSLPQSREVESGVGRDYWAIRTELDIIHSTTILEQAAEKLIMDDSAGFNRTKQKGKETPLLSPAKKAQRVKWIARGLQGGLNTEQIRDSYVIAISYTSKDPVQAAAAANAIADAYLNDQIEQKLEERRIADKWLLNRMGELRKEVREAEIEVNELREESDMIKARGSTILEQQISDVNAQLIQARVKLSRAKAKLSKTRELISKPGGEEALGEVVDSASIQRLRDIETTLSRKRAELSLRYGPKHPRMITMEAEIADVQNRIKEETGRIIKSFENEVQTAMAVEKSLTESLDRLRMEAVEAMDAELKLREMERPAQSARVLYQQLLTKFQQTRKMDALQRPDARIISYAETPLTPSHPPRRKTMTMAFLAGLFLGIAGVFLAENMDRGFRTSEQVEKVTGISALGTFPLLDEGLSKPVEHVLEKPYSAMAETLRSFHTALRLSNVDNPPETVIITSALPMEGKSSFSASLGRVIAMSGFRVLLIDADLRRPILAKVFSHIKSDIYIEDILQEQQSGRRESLIKKAIIKDKESGLYLLRANGKSSAGRDMLNSQRMRQILDQFKKRFDLVILDAPPFMGVSDVWTLAQSVDALVFLVKWGKTPRDTVLDALRQMKLLEINPAGIVLSMVDAKKQSYYSYGGYGYYYKRYKKYYND